MKRILSTVLVFAMVFCSMPISSFANVNSREEVNYSVSDARKIFEAMDPAAQKIFEQFIAENQYRDSELYNFHVKNVDPTFEMELSISSYSMEMDSVQPRMEAMAMADPMSVLQAELQILNLPSAVYYSLMSVGASLAAAAADGALPFGDIAAIVAAIVTGGVVGYYWDEVGPKWSKITRAFSRAFDSVMDNIDDVFEDIKLDLIYKSIPSRLKRGMPDGYVDLDLFTEKVSGGKTYKYPKTGHQIDKDQDEHGGRKWKLKTKRGKRLASLDENGKVLAD